MTKTLTEQVLNLQKMVEEECSRRCELEERLADEIAVSDELLNVQKRLEKKLEIAIKALKDVAYLYIYTDKDLSTVANNALKEMKGVK